MTPDPDGPAASCSPDASGDIKAATSLLNTTILALFARANLPPASRPDRLGRLLVVETPEDVNHILDAPDRFEKNFALVAAFGPSRFNLNGAAWADLRGRTQRHYARGGRPAMQGGIAAIYREELDALPTPTATDLEQALARAALRVFFHAFGLAPDVTPFLAQFARLRVAAALLQYYSWDGSNAAARDATERLAHHLRADFMDTCAADPAVLALVRTLASQPPAIPLEDAMADLMTNMFAGIETTTASLSWMIDSLGRNQALQDHLRADVGTGAAMLTRFRNECLRVFPPIPFVVRSVVADTRLGTRDLAAGDLLLISLVGLHRDPGAWSAPGRFHATRPEFAPDAAPNPAFRPFLSGPRACGGRRIAEIEMTEALRHLLTSFRLESPPADPAFAYGLAFRPVLTPGHLVQRL